MFSRTNYISVSFRLPDDTTTIFFFSTKWPSSLTRRPSRRPFNWSKHQISPQYFHLLYIELEWNQTTLITLCISSWKVLHGVSCPDRQNDSKQIRNFSLNLLPLGRWFLGGCYRWTPVSSVSLRLTYLWDFCCYFQLCCVDEGQGKIVFSSP